MHLQNVFSIKSWQNCPGNQSMNFFTNISSHGNAKNVFFSGRLELTEDVRGPLELVVLINRCDVAMKKCERIPPIRVPKLCSRFSDTKAFYSGAFAGITPRLECPMTERIYTATDSSIDLAAISFLPMGEFMWIMTLKINSGEEGKSKLALCIEMELKIIRAGRQRRP